MEELNNFIFPLCLIFFGYFFSKYLLLLFKKSKTNLLIDNQFKKPQAFHENSTYRLGGTIIFSLLVLVFAYLKLSKNVLPFDYISFCALFFLLGLVDDLRINIPPKFRLLIMATFLLTLVTFNETYINKTGLDFLNHLISIDIFSIMFVCLCFLIIINGSNLIDGFNGLLGIHALIIFIILFFINLVNENNSLIYILLYIILLILIFLKNNFPKSKIFLGDSGAYLIGTLIAISVIKTSNFNPSISPFFFCILLFYLFFEVFFSFFRKLFVVRRSPLFPDNKHLHMLLYKFFLSKNKSKKISNYIASIYINIMYLLSIIPGFIFMKNGLFCRYYFLFLVLLYLYFYKKLYKKVIR